jgi:hypothetical protein
MPQNLDRRKNDIVFKLEIENLKLFIDEKFKTHNESIKNYIQKVDELNSEVLILQKDNNDVKNSIILIKWVSTVITVFLAWFGVKSKF